LIDRAVSINLENAVSVIKNFVSRGINTIVPYPLSQKNYDYFISNLKGLGIEISIFTLSPSLEKALTNRGMRTLTAQEVDRIKYHYSIGIHKPSFGVIIDNTDQTPEETTGHILAKI